MGGGADPYIYLHYMQVFCIDKATFQLGYSSLSGKILIYRKDLNNPQNWSDFARNLKLYMNYFDIDIDFDYDNLFVKYKPKYFDQLFLSKTRVC